MNVIKPVRQLYSLAMMLGLTAFGILISCTDAEASPFFSIGEGGALSWQQALDEQAIVPVFANQGFTGPADQFYSSQTGVNFQLVDSFIYAADDPVELDGESHEALVMGWNPPDPGNPTELPVAAWEYVYDADPDLTNAMVHFSLGVPPEIDPSTGQPFMPLIPAIWDVSIELIDIDGEAKGWFLSMPPVGWSEWWLDTDLGDQGPWVNFTDPGFDLDKVVRIRLDEAGNVVDFPAFPPPDPGGLWDWNAWNHLTVVPEPSSVILALLSSLALLGCRRRKQ